MKTVAVTGFNGYIGSIVGRELLANGYKVIGLSVEDKPVIMDDNLSYFQVDLTEWKQVQSIFSNNGIDILLHFAAIAHAIKGQKIPDETFRRTNYLAAKHLFSCANEKGIRVFFASTIDVYGACKERLWSEEVLPQPVSIYGKTKLLAEHSLQEIFKKNKEKYLIARFAPVYSQNRMQDIHKRIYLKYPFFVLDLRTDPTYPFLALENLVAFILSWIKKGYYYHNIINVSDEKNISGKELIAQEKSKGRANFVLRVPKIVVSMMAFIGNKLLYSKRAQSVGLSLTKLFYPREITKTRMRDYMQKNCNSSEFSPYQSNSNN